MTARLLAGLVHLLTASGAALALLALLAAANSNWQSMFAWLGLALIVDGIDGPLARAAKVEQILPRFSGVRLDLIVDYLTYVAVPAFALSRAELLPQAFRLPAAIAILLSSLFHVADRESKTEDGYFVGFPAIWNIVCLYLFAFMPSPALALGLIVVLVATTFVPIHYVHPLRVARLRPITLIVTALWTAGAVGAVLNPFTSPLWVELLLGSTALYFVFIGATRFHGADHSE
jgi:phosphatidylcholine synthase